MYHAVNNKLVTLITKGPITHTKDYRPISCCITIYKIISKVIEMIFGSVLCNIIDHIQIAFVSG